MILHNSANNESIQISITHGLPLQEWSFSAIEYGAEFELTFDIITPNFSCIFEATEGESYSGIVRHVNEGIVIVCTFESNFLHCFTTIKF